MKTRKAASHLRKSKLLPWSFFIALDMNALSTRSAPFATGSCMSRTMPAPPAGYFFMNGFLHEDMPEIRQGNDRGNGGHRVCRKQRLGIKGQCLGANVSCANTAKHIQQEWMNQIQAEGGIANGHENARRLDRQGIEQQKHQQCRQAKTAESCGPQDFDPVMQRRHGSDGVCQNSGHKAQECPQSCRPGADLFFIDW